MPPKFAIKLAFLCCILFTYCLCEELLISLHKLETSNNISGTDTYYTSFILPATTFFITNSSSQLESENAENPLIILGCSTSLSDSSKLEDYYHFVSQNCPIIIPISNGIERNSFPDGICIPIGRDYNITHLLFTMSGENMSDIKSSVESSSVVLTYDKSKKNCKNIGKFIKSSSYNTEKRGVLTSDFYFSAKVDNIDTSYIPFAVTNAVNQPCRDLIVWKISPEDDWVTLGSSSNNGTANLIKLQSVNLNSTSRLLVRCLLDPDNIDFALVYVSYYANAEQFELTSTAASNYESNPPVSYLYPHVCYSSASISKEFHVAEDIYVSSISLLNIYSSHFSLFACAISSYDVNDTFPCNGDFVPLFSGQDFMLADTSSIYLGPNSNHQILVLYGFMDEMENLCIDLHLSEKTDNAIGVMLFAAPGGSIPPNSTHNLDLSCMYENDQSIMPVMYRIHTHKLGKSVVMWLKRGETWQLIINEDNPDAIYSVADRYVIKKGDDLKVRCSYNTTTKSTPTPIGSDTNLEEMCNLYLYYSVPFDNLNTVNDCFNMNDFNPPPIKYIDHDAPLNEDVAGFYLHLNTSWNGTFNSVMKNGPIVGIGALSDDTIILLQSSENDYNNNSMWFDDDNIIRDKTKVIKKNILSTFSLTDETITHSSGMNRFYLPSGFFVSHNGDIFLSDLGLHEVMKFHGTKITPKDRALLSLGSPFAPNNDQSHFCKPTSIVEDFLGNIYVGDGLCNSRVLKFDDDGSYIASFGGPFTTLNATGDFAVISDLTIDVTRDVIYILDTVSNQIQIMDYSGEFLRILNLRQYPNITKIEYCPGIDSIAAIRTMNNISYILIVHPISGSVLHIINSTSSSELTELAWISNNRLLAGGKDGRLWMFYRSQNHPEEAAETAVQTAETTVQTASTVKDPDDALSNIVPLIHFLLHTNPSSDEEKQFLDKSSSGWMSGIIEKVKNKDTLVIVIAASVTIVLMFGIILVILTVVKIHKVKRRAANNKYQRCVQSDTDSEDVVFDGLHEVYEESSVL